MDIPDKSSSEYVLYRHAIFATLKENHPDLHDFFIAPSGEGTRYGDWFDKPHRLLYDLIAMCVEERNKHKLLGEDNEY